MLTKTMTMRRRSIEIETVTEGDEEKEDHDWCRVGVEVMTADILPGNRIGEVGIGTRRGTPTGMKRTSIEGEKEIGCQVHPRE
jgi:hypothetical protein